MDKQIGLWIAVIAKTRETIIETFNYNGLIIDDLEALIKDMQRAKDETKSGIYPCENCGDKVVTNIECKACYHKRCPWDREI